LTRSNKLFQDRGFEKKLQYQISLSITRNPDFLIRHPNETEAKNKVGWKADIKKRVLREEDIRNKLLVSRAQKKTGARRFHDID